MGNLGSNKESHHIAYTISGVYTATMTVLTGYTEHVIQLIQLQYNNYCSLPTCTRNNNLPDTLP